MTTAQDEREGVDTRGAALFARYAVAPNELGFCGPPTAGALRRGSAAEIRAAAERFSGAWPYLTVLARLTGLDDPLDHRVVEAYWLGGGVGADLDPRAFGIELLAVIGPQAGHYWAHLTEDLLDEVAPNHAFHVLGVYPWSRLLGRGADEHAVGVLDSCRISWGTVTAVDDEQLEVSRAPLVFDGRSLTLGEPTPTRVRAQPDDPIAIADLAVGDRVALHWNRLCDRLEPTQVTTLEDTTRRQLHLTNRRIRRSG